MDKLLNQNEELSQEIINLQEQLSRKDSQNLEVLEQAEQWKEKACSQEEQIQRLNQEMSENLSANSMLKSKLQQKSEMIRLLNDKIGRFHENDKILKENINLKLQNKELQEAKEKALTEVAKVKSAYAEKTRALDTKQWEIKNAQRNQNALIQRKAEELYTIKKHTQQALNLSFLLYSYIITLFIALRSKTLRIDSTAFLRQAWNILRITVLNVKKTAIRASEFGGRVEKQSLAIVLHNLLPIIVILAALALFGFIIYILIGLIENELRKKNIPYELKTVNSGIQNRTVGIFLGRLGQLHNDADIMYYIYSKPEYISEIKSIANDCLNKFK